MLFGQVNWLAVVVGAVITMVLGFLWYGPLFGQMWMRMVGRNPEEIEAEPTMYVYTALSALISAYVLALVVRAAGADTLVGGAVAGAVVWVGLGATATFVKDLFDGPRRDVWLLYSAYQLVAFALQGALFALWR